MAIHPDFPKSPHSILNPDVLYFPANRNPKQPGGGDETVWLTITQMAELFQVDKSGISRHLMNVYAAGELLPGATVAKIAMVRIEGGSSFSGNWNTTISTPSFL